MNTSLTRVSPNVGNFWGILFVNYIVTFVIKYLCHYLSPKWNPKQKQLLVGGVHLQTATEYASKLPTNTKRTQNSAKFNIQLIHFSQLKAPNIYQYWLTSKTCYLKSRRTNLAQACFLLLSYFLQLLIIFLISKNSMFHWRFLEA